MRSAVDMLALLYRWFKAQGVSVSAYSNTKAAVSSSKKLPLIRATPDRADARAVADAGAAQPSSRLLLCDFDKTIADFDAGPGCLHAVHVSFALSM